MVTARKAKTMGMVDGVATLDEVIADMQRRQKRTASPRAQLAALRVAARQSGA
jgi:ClpP class serine protease